MIIVRIIYTAGLGNQMFQYAAGLATAHRLNTELRLGAWNYEQNTTSDRGYYLHYFPAIMERNASFQETWKISPRLALMTLVTRKRIKKYHIIRRVIRKLDQLLPNSKLYKSRYGSYSPEFEEIPDNSCMMGWYESEKIFEGIKDLVRARFKFAPECFSHELCAKVRECNSVVLHVRRGDKVYTDGTYASDERYMRQAMEKMSSLTDSPKFFVFSDDIAWCRENLPKVYDTEYTFIEGQNPAQDMALMTQCKHVIMGPSTFSWWGAWLNENPNKIIIAPDINLWYKPGSQDFEERKHLLPESWIKLA